MFPHTDDTAKISTLLFRGFMLSFLTSCPVHLQNFQISCRENQLCVRLKSRDFPVYPSVTFVLNFVCSLFSSNFYFILEHRLLTVLYQFQGVQQGDSVIYGLARLPEPCWFLGSLASAWAKLASQSLALHPGSTDTSLEKWPHLSGHLCMLLCSLIPGLSSSFPSVVLQQPSIDTLKLFLYFEIVLDGNIDLI